MDVKHGLKISAYNVPMDILLARREFAVKLVNFVVSLTKLKESANHAIKGIVSSMEPVKGQLRIVDVQPGMAILASNAHKDGTSIQKESAHQSVINAPPGTVMETA
jgi:hypothetical protein